MQRIRTLGNTKLTFGTNHVARWVKKEMKTMWANSFPMTSGALKKSYSFMFWLMMPNDVEMVLGGDDVELSNWGIYSCFLREFDILSYSHTFSLPRAIGRHPWRLFRVLGSFPLSSLGPNIHPWCFLSFGIEEGDDLHIGCLSEWDMNMKLEVAVRRCLWKKLFFFSLVLIYFPCLQFVNPKFSIIES